VNFVPARNEFDFIVVGGGAAGCIVAARLSEDPQIRVCLLEGGGSDRSPVLRIPVCSAFLKDVPRYTTIYGSEPQDILGNRAMPLPQGKVIGGSGSINGMIFMRGHSREYDGWGIPGWSFAEILPFFKHLESNERGENHWHGASGPVSVAKGRSDLPICERFLDAALRAGIPIVDDLNADVAEGLGYYDKAIANGKRQSSAAVYLRPARRRKNLTVFSRASASKIIFEGRRAVGVEYVRNGRVETLRGTCEIILCAGAMVSPKLLMLSGVGPADHLRAMSIPIVAEAPDVGRNFQNHVSYNLAFHCSEPITVYKFIEPAGLLSAGARYLASRRGFLVNSAINVGGLLRTDPALAISDVKISLVSALPRGGNGLLAAFPRRHGFVITIHQGSPYSRGEIQLKSLSPFDAPVLRPNYLADSRDVDTLIGGVARAQEIVAQAPLAAISKQISAKPTDRKGLRQDILATARNVFHPVGTCRMGLDQAAVVDPALQVKGVEGLRVADASVFPTLMNANTYAPTMMLAEMAASIIAAGAAAREGSGTNF
jgi:choline dehydrogenase